MIVLLAHASGLGYVLIFQDLAFCWHSSKFMVFRVHHFLREPTQVLCYFCCYNEAWGRSFLRSSFSPLTTRTNPGSGSDKASQAPTWAAFLAEEIPQCSSCGRNLTISICLQCLLALWITAQAPQRPWLYSTRMAGKYCQKNSPLSGAGDFQIWAESLGGGQPSTRDVEARKGSEKEQILLKLILNNHLRYWLWL